MKKALHSVIDALKSEPLGLSMVVVNVALVCLLYVVADRAAANRQRELMLIFEHCIQKDR